MQGEEKYGTKAIIALLADVRTKISAIEENAVNKKEFQKLLSEIDAIEEELDNKEDAFSPGEGLEMTENRILNITLDLEIFWVNPTVPDTPPVGKDNKILLVPNPSSKDESNYYTEYIWVIDTEHPDGHYEELGTYKSDIDLSTYLTKTGFIYASGGERAYRNNIFIDDVTNTSNNSNRVRIGIISNADLKSRGIELEVIFFDKNDIGLVVTTEHWIGTYNSEEIPYIYSKDDTKQTTIDRYLSDNDIPTIFSNNITKNNIKVGAIFINKENSSEYNGRAGMITDIEYTTDGSTIVSIDVFYRTDKNGGNTINYSYNDYYNSVTENTSTAKYTKTVVPIIYSNDPNISQDSITDGALFGVFDYDYSEYPRIGIIFNVSQSSTSVSFKVIFQDHSQFKYKIEEYYLDVWESPHTLTKQSETTIQAQQTSDDNLQTTDKNIVGAINEINNKTPVYTIVPTLSADYTIPANSTTREYVYEITIGSTIYNVNAAEGIKWIDNNLPLVEANSKLIVSVVNNIAVWGIVYE